jgi:putative FmdB family regulatory protein
MPIYSYKCEKCGRIFDELQKAGYKGNIKCIYCNSDASRLFSPVGVIFKGSGFYTTDYKSNSRNFRSNNTSTSKEKDNKKSESKFSGKKETGTLSKKND